MASRASLRLDDTSCSTAPQDPDSHFVVSIRRATQSANRSSSVAVITDPGRSTQPRVRDQPRHGAARRCSLPAWRRRHRPRSGQSLDSSFAAIGGERQQQGDDRPFMGSVVSSKRWPHAFLPNALARRWDSRRTGGHPRRAVRRPVWHSSRSALRVRALETSTRFQAKHRVLLMRVTERVANVVGGQVAADKDRVVPKHGSDSVPA
jgi:hypothetical protein